MRDLETELIYRSALERVWRAGVERVGGHAAVVEALSDKRMTKPDAIVAVGKAATGMLEAALSFAGYDTKSLLITKYDHVICRHRANQAKLEEYQSDGTLQIIEAAHPIPDENSLAAGAALTAFVEELGADQHLLVLVSGGASALAEQLPENMNLEKLQQITDEMLSQGLAISHINNRRKQFSQIKDGKLLAKFRGEQLTVMALSDVEGDKIEIIGSGIASSDKVDKRVNITSQIIASNQIARDACAKKAQLLGFEICENSQTAYGDIHTVAQEIIAQIIKGNNGVYIFGGEPTVILPDNPGSGGRNQHLALLLAKMLEGQGGIEFLVGGSDGSDGPTKAAGGFADGNTFTPHDLGQIALDRADAGSFLDESGNLFVTGPTGTNVMDLIIGIKQ